MTDNLKRKTRAGGGANIWTMVHAGTAVAVLTSKVWNGGGGGSIHSRVRQVLAPAQRMFFSCTSRQSNPGQSGLWQGRWTMDHQPRRSESTRCAQHHR